MGVFARFRRRKETETAEASSQETAAVTQAEVSSDGTADPDEQAEGAPATAEADHQEEAAAAEGVEIPKQQSAEEAADNEAGESARK